MGTYTDTDGVVKSAVDEGDIVRVTGENTGTMDNGQDLIIIPDDSDIDETTTTEEQFGETEVVTKLSDKTQTVIDLTKAVVSSADPTSGLIKTGIAAKGLRATSKLKNSKFD